MVLPAKVSRIDEAREAFVRRHEKPIYKELSEEFDLPLSTVGNTAADQGWTAMRAAHLEAKMRECDASAVILQAVQVDRTIIHSFADCALVALAGIKTAMESIPPDRAAQTKLDAYNTGCFALNNLSKALHEVGIVGVSKTLPGAGKEDNGRWNPEMLTALNQQINVTIQQAAAGQASVAAPSAVDVPSSPGKPQSGEQTAS